MDNITAPSVHYVSDVRQFQHACPKPGPKSLG